MAQFVDFVGLNTFIYEMSGYLPETYYTSDDISFVEFVPIGYNGSMQGFAYNNTIGTFGITDVVTSYANIDPRSTLRYMVEFRDIRNLTNNKFPLHLSASMHGIPSSASYFPALMLKRNGPYGHPMFKQIRVHQNPLTRRQIKENIFTIVESPSQEAIRTFGNNKIETIRSRYGNIVGFREAMVTSRYQPLDWLLGFSSDDERIINAENPSQENIERLILRNSYGNDINFFANTELNNRLGLETEEDEDYERISNFYLNGGLDADDSPASTFEFLKYRETVFPRETNTFRAISRKRTNYLNNFWRDDREDRSIITTDVFGNRYVDTVSGSGYTKPSIWPLDADINFDSRDIENISEEFVGFNTDGGGFNAEGQLSGGAGILQNQYCQITNKVVADLGSGDPQPQFDRNFRAGPLYSRRHTLSYNVIQGVPALDFTGSVTGSVVSPDGILIPETSTANSGFRGLGVKGQGQALWEAGTQAGKNPFYSSYDYWWEQLRLKAKDYSVVPEFRISEFIDIIEKSGSQTFIDNMFEVTGGSSGEVNAFDPSAFFFGNDSSETKFYETYSTSDFMKHFAKIKKDHDEFVEPSKITLTCKAFKKFLAYDSFYPANRTVDLATQFSRSYADNIDYTSSLGDTGGTHAKFRRVRLQTILKPLMAPGILFNSIKSGIACDYPILFDELSTTGHLTGSSSDPEEFFVNITNFDGRLPFETIYNPEKFLFGKNIACDEPDPNANTRVVAKLQKGSDNLYKKMINNFLAETTNFFLEDSQLSFIVSKKQSDPSFGVMEAGKTYGMRIKIGKTYSSPKKIYTNEKGDYFPPNNYIEGDDFARENITMYSRPSAFGPPSRGLMENSHSAEGAMTGASGMGSYIGYNFPYTPPYYYGEAYCDVLFEADTTQKYTLTEILQNSKYYIIRVDPECYASSSLNIRGLTDTLNAPGLGIQGTGSLLTYVYDSSYGSYSSRFGDNIYNDGLNKSNFISMKSNVDRFSMQLISSINVNGKAVLSEGGGLSFTSLADGDPNERWVIQPKWETPILNFNDVSITTNANYDAQAPRGMWHQYGRIPESNESIFMQVTDIPTSWNDNFIGVPSSNNPTGSLIDVCGFDTSQVKLGKIESKKIIKEAVVAVPYIQKANRKQFYSIGEDQVFNAKKFIDIIRKEAIGAPRDGDQLPEFYQDKTTSVIIDMVRKMDEFVFPPTMDFVHFPEKVKPFAMYIFEFSHELNQQDLADIWQNLPPRLGENFEEAEATISHPLFSDHFLSSVQREEGQQTPTGGTIDTEIRWMIFKVKQRAETDYSSKVVSGVSNKTLRKKVLFPKSPQERKENIDSLLSYNWPYDYFSLVELVKLDAEFTFADIDPNNPDALGRKGNPNKDKAKKTIQSRLKQPAPPAPPASEAPSTLPPTANNSEASQPNQGQPGPGMGMQTQTARFKAAQIAGVFPKPGGN
jgi:hypothetical protein